MDRALLTPAAIVAGSLIIATGLYLGLRERSDAPAAPAAPSVSAPVVAASSAEAADVPAAPVSAAPVVPAEESLKAARQALLALRPALRAKCWDPFAAKKPEPKLARYVYSVSFDAQGKQAAQGISEVRGLERHETVQCLRAEPMSLTIPAPGTTVNLTLDLELP